MKEKIKAFICKYNMLSADDHTAVAFSGGADSTALLDMLYKSGIRVAAIHINHMIRGEEADLDEQFCRLFCAERNIPFFSKRINVPLEAQKSGEGLEEAARRLRYAAIEKIAAAQGITKIATAHHADDNAETLIFNITRGSGLRGAGGIPPVRDIYIRPLLCCSREEILEYCKEHGLSFVIDSTNADTDYTRNYIRHKIIPAIRELNPNYAEAFFRFTQSVRQDNGYIEQIANSYSNTTPRNILAELPDAVLSRYIRKEAAKFEYIPSHHAVESVMRAIRQGNEFIKTDLGCGITAVCDRDKLYLTKGGENKAKDYYVRLQYGENEIPGAGRIYLARGRQEADKLKNIYKISIHTCLKFDKIIGNLFARPRKEGDSYRYGGMTRSLKKLFNAKKIPVCQRDLIPIIKDNTGIIWVPGFPPREDTAAKNEDNILFIGYNSYDNE